MPSEQVIMIRVADYHISNGLILTILGWILAAAFVLYIIFRLRSKRKPPVRK